MKTIFLLREVLDLVNLHQTLYVSFMVLKLIKFILSIQYNKSKRIEALWSQLRKHTTGWWITAFKVCNMRLS